MPEAIPKEAIEFMTRFGGATASMLEQLAFEWWWSTHPEARGKFPYTRPELHMPMWHEIIVEGLAIPPWVIGLLVGDDAKKKGDTKTAELAKSVELFGEGSIFYATPMLVHTTAVHNTPVKTATAPAAPPQAETPQRQAGIVYKL